MPYFYSHRVHSENDRRTGRPARKHAQHSQLTLPGEIGIPRMGEGST